MRASKRAAILEAAVAVIEAEGITAVTFDSVAAESGITRGGVIYHFRSRDELIRAIHQQLAEQWERQLEMACGKPAARASSRERLTAYIRTAATPATRAQVHMILDSYNTTHQPIWTDVLERWAPGHTPNDEAQPSRMLALLAADGLWLNDLVGTDPVAPHERSAMAEHIINLLDHETTS
jgi:AcrR family transcriptional regulator